MARYYTRNTPTEHVCPVCKGAGELTKNTSFDQDPQCDFEVACTEPRCMNGWIRWAPIDPLEVMHSLRHRRHHPVVGLRYGDAFARAMTDVSLPADLRNN